MNPLVSVLIVNWNTRELLLECLRRVYAEGESLALEVLVVDNASSDQSVEAVRSAFPQARVIANPENRGFAAATNQALAVAQGAYLLLLNPDAWLEPAALRTLLNELKQFPEVWAVGPQLLNADRSLQPSGRHLPSLPRFALEGLMPAHLKRTPRWTKRVYGRVDFNRPAIVDEVSGACFLASAQAFRRVGSLDERFYIYFEEVDWFRRLKALGGQVHYQPAARVIHQGGAATGQAPSPALAYHFQSAFRYWGKYLGWPGELLTRAVALLQLLAWTLGTLGSTVLGQRNSAALPGSLTTYARIFAMTLGWPLRSGRTFRKEAA